jgi:hypothetical protein
VPLLPDVPLSFPPDCAPTFGDVGDIDCEPGGTFLSVFEGPGVVDLGVGEVCA